jgi:hypothetical protein
MSALAATLQTTIAGAIVQGLNDEEVRKVVHLLRKSQFSNYEST